MAHGGKRPGAGRKAGIPNKSTGELKAHAQQYTPEAIDFLVSVMRNAEAPFPARVSAANSVLDRGHGKPAQAITGPDGERLETPHSVRFIYQPIPGSHNQT